MHGYFPGMLVGFIILQTAIVAPTLLKKLGREQLGIAIRALWPRFLIGLAVLGAGSLAALPFSGGSVAQYAIAGATVTGSVVCYATDTGNHVRLKVLHQLSVGLTVLMLLGNIGAAFR